MQAGCACVVQYECRRRKRLLFLSESKMNNIKARHQWFVFLQDMRVNFLQSELIVCEHIQHVILPLVCQPVIVSSALCIMFYCNNSPSAVFSRNSYVVINTLVQCQFLKSCHDENKKFYFVCWEQQHQPQILNSNFVYEEETAGGGEDKAEEDLSVYEGRDATT